MASGHRKRKAELLRKYTLNLAGLTNVAEADRGITANQNNLLLDSIYSNDGYAPTFTEGSQTLLSDAVSNANSNWTLIGYGGETSAQAAGFIPSNAIHRYIPAAGDASSSYTDSTPVILYTHDGPQGYFNQYYLPTINQVAGTSSVRFNNQITGAAGTLSNLRVWVAGAVPTGTIGASITVFTGANGTAGSPLITFTSGSGALISASFAKTTNTAITIQYSSSANTYNLNSFVPGILVYISGSTN